MSQNSIVAKLRSLSKGKRVFRVQRKTDKSYCIQFEEWEQIEAGEWWKSNREKEKYADFELALVEIDSEQDRTMREAANMLELVFEQMDKREMEAMAKSKHLRSQLHGIAFFVVGCAMFSVWGLVPRNDTLNENWIFIDGWLFRVPVFLAGCFCWMRALWVLAEEK